MNINNLNLKSKFWLIYRETIQQMNSNNWNASKNASALNALTEIYTQEFSTATDMFQFECDQLKRINSRFRFAIITRSLSDEKLSIYRAKEALIMKKLALEVNAMTKINLTCMVIDIRQIQTLLYNAASFKGDEKRYLNQDEYKELKRLLKNLSIKEILNIRIIPD